MGPVLKPHFRLPLAVLLICAEAFGQGSEPLLKPERQLANEFEPVDVQYGNGSVNPVAVLSEVPPSVSTSDSLLQLREEIAVLKSQIQQVNYASSVEGQHFSPAGCAEGCGDGCATASCCCKSRRLFGSVEVPFLQPRISGAFPVFNVSPSADRLIESDYTAAIRYQAEFRPVPTLGIRGRFFRFDSDSPFSAPFQPAELGIRLDSADLEFVIHQTYCSWNFDLSAGVQYGRIGYSTDTATAVGVGAVRFEGVGPVFAANAEHKLGNTNLALFGGVRASFLMGSTTNGSLLVNVPQSTIHNEMMQVYQNQLGVVWKPDLFESVGIAVRAGWETQFWMNDTFADDSYGIGSNLSLTGPMVSAEVSY